MSEPVKTWVAPRAEDWTTMIFTLRFRFSYNNDNDQVDEDKGSSQEPITWLKFIFLK